jgi:cystathionine gamma-synthase
MLGQPLPLTNHAVSVSLPTWKDVVGYEEGCKEVIDCLKLGYPR